jgi:IPT/TIG domain-containing protein
VKRSALVMLAALVVLLGGCAQAILPGGPGAPGGPGLTALTVSPSGASIPGVAQQQFTAKTGDGSRPAVNWSINGIAGGNANFGTIDANGMYTAPEFPPAPNSITIRAVETSDSRKLGNASVTLNNPVPQLTSVTPMSIAQGPFTMTLSGLHFAPSAVAYMGTTALPTTYVSSTKLAAAGTATIAQAGTQTITVHNPDPGASVSAGVNIVVTGAVAVVVTPATAMVRTGNQQAFTATVTGALNLSVTWTVNGVAGGNSTIGTIAANGTYTAPLTLPTPNTVTVTATSVEDPTRSGSATVTLENAIPVISSVTPTTLTAGTQFEMTVNGTGFTPGSIVKLGAISLSTTYIAPTQLIAVGTPTLAQVGTVPVTVVNPDPGGSTSAPFNVQVVGPNSNITVTVSPKTATLGAGNVQQFQVTVTGTIDLSVVWSVNGVNSGNSAAGRIDFLGNYTAPDNILGLGSVTVTATSNANPAKSDSAVVTLTNPVPTLTSIAPATLGLGAFQITLNGTGFVSTSTATFGGQPMQVTYVTSTMITAVGNASNTQLGAVTVKVTNPAPGGGTSNGLNVTVTTAGSPESSAAAVRFLEQSSFGPDLENVNQVEETGFDTYLKN